MGREHRIIAALGRHRRARAPGHRPLHRRRGQRRAVLRHGLRRRARPAQRRRPPASSPEAARATADQLDGRRAGRASTPSTSTPSGSATSAATTATSSASSSAGTGQWEKTEDPRAAGHRRRARPPRRARSPTRARPPSSTATTGSTTACSTPTATSPAVLDWELCTLGDPLADVGLLLRVLDRARRHPRSPSPARPPPSRASPPGPSCWPATPRPPGRDLCEHRLLRRLRLLEAGLHHRGRATPATRPASWATGRRQRPGRDASTIHVADLAAAAATTLDMDPEVEQSLFEFHEDPGWQRPGPDRGPRGLDRRGRRGGRPQPSASWPRSPTRRRWPPSTPTPCSTTGPGARSCTWSTGSTPA